MTVMVEARQVGKSVKTHDAQLHILSDISLVIDKAESVAIVGASGSGKSTLLGLMAGLDQASEGEIWLAGELLNDMDEDARAKLRGQSVGFVFQSFQLLPSLTALENVMLPIELKQDPQARHKATQLLQRVGLADRLTHYPNQLSGGEQQRVAIARAFASEASILFADEPTGNLDTETGATVIELLFELNAEFSTTLILVTHDDRLAARCARTVRLSSGRIVGDSAKASPAENTGSVTEPGQESAQA
ncbi:ABC transporter ATP-binding protein [Pseudohongiella nitratireducens]|uniref:ABC transporter ATP-binding protein n=1 Tax=Pseudohongiella nitratireducens TaxID=1768907 RepID=A0A917GQ00_9GAMM|nr:ABC transporter ATP-binding protein [Pseudohongiella nitratireducens]MDF1622834.1 ABC transporter ATP-binding protein [Pseudohongiella nitratireducens]GGG53967.1 ABC transporter ATP-binding protein [Pseudohongiella nitratireducens]|tara:strand:- start:16812 stop:17552 length:741 start_codon:yes stop_codon:yes gene_type:complete